MRSRFSSSTLRLKGSRATSYFDCSASRRKIVCSRSPTFRVSRASNEFGWSAMVRVLWFQASSGSSTKGSPSGVVIDRKCWSKVAMRLRAQQPGERDERGVGRARANGWRRAIASVSSSASAHQRTRVGAGVEVAPQRLARRAAAALARRGSPSRRRRAAWRRGPRRRVATQSATSRWSGSAASYSATTTFGVEDDGQSSPKPSHHLVPVAPDAQAVGAAEDADVRLGPPRLLHARRQRAADELGFGEALVGGAAGESLVQIGVQIEARLLHPT